MKKQLVSILFALCMVLCLVPLAAFAEGETENVQVVADQTTLVAAMADTSVTTVKLAADIDIDATLKVDRTVTLDLNGYVLKYVSANCGCWTRQAAQRPSPAALSPAARENRFSSAAANMSTTHIMAAVCISHPAGS